MSIFIPILAGLVWGALAALLGGLVTRACLKKNSNGALLGGNFLRLAIDLAALGSVFLLRNALPFDYSISMIAAAVALSLGTIVISFRLAAGQKK